MDRLLAELITQHLTPTPSLCLMALGGYGRAELCPYSDIDIMFLTPEGAEPGENAAIEKFLYALWDRGLKVGHSTRSLSDCETLARKDSKILTSLLDARLIAGN